MHPEGKAALAFPAVRQTARAWSLPCSTPAAEWALPPLDSVEMEVEDAACHLAWFVGIKVCFFLAGDAPQRLGFGILKVDLQRRGPKAEVCREPLCPVRGWGRVGSRQTAPAAARTPDSIYEGQTRK